MGVQLLSEVVGLAVGALLYSILCLGCSGLTIWLVWTHHERTSYVAFLSYFTLLSTLASILQQIHTIVYWRDIKIQQWKNMRANPDSIEIIIAGPSYGIDLVLFYIQYTAYNIESLFFMFWAGALTQSVFGYTSTMFNKTIRRNASSIAKGVAIVLPAILLSILRVPAVQNSYYAYLLLANVTMMVGITIGGILLIVILGKYIHTRRSFGSWHVKYGKSTRPHKDNNSSEMDVTDGQSKSIYDNWLVVRFAIAFVMLGLFQLSTIHFQAVSYRTKKTPGSSANLSAEKASKDFLNFMPGVSTSLLVFVLFGTTAPFRSTMKQTFVPRWLTKRLTRRKRRAKAPSLPPLKKPKQSGLIPMGLKDKWLLDSPCLFSPRKSAFVRLNDDDSDFQFHHGVDASAGPKTSPTTTTTTRKFGGDTHNNDSSSVDWLTLTLPSPAKLSPV